MYKNRFITVAVSVVLAVFCGIAYAGTAAEPVMKMNEPAYTAHKKGIVVFTHKRHVQSIK